MQKVLAKLITYLFFPGAMGFFGYLILNHQSKNMGYHGLFIILLPLVMVLLLLKTKTISDIGIYHRKERLIPLLVTMALALLDVLLIKETGHAFLWQLVYLIVGVAATLATVFLLKISLHGMGVGAFFGLCLFLWVNLDLRIEWVAASFVILLAVYWSRRALQAHSHKELVTGVSTGFFITFALYTVYGLQLH